MIKTIIAHKIRLEPNAEQIIHLSKACGVSRKAYNWALNKANKDYEIEQAKKLLNPVYKIKSVKENELRKELNKIKRIEFPYMLEVTKCAPQLAIKNLGKAFTNFFTHQSGYPTFKKKGIHDSFQLSNDHIKIDGKAIKIPNLGWVKTREKLRFDGKIMNATISRKANQWFASVCVEIETAEIINKLSKAQNNGEIGIDLGIKHLATLSNGVKYENPKALNNLLHRVKVLSRRLSKKTLGSKNRHKAKMQLAKVHLKVSNQRADCLHKLTTQLTSNYSNLVIEDLNVKGMLKNHKLARSIADVGFYEFKRQLTYKAACRGNEVVLADRFFPSSKLCHVCKVKNPELQLSDREWTCSCGAKHDRDMNAAINLLNYEQYVTDGIYTPAVKVKKQKVVKNKLPIV